MNCLEKYAVTSMLSITAICYDCTPNAVLEYEWKLQHFINGTYEDIPSLINMTETRKNSFSFFLEKNSYWICIIVFFTQGYCNDTPPPQKKK